jgi:hypothetical protein
MRAITGQDLPSPFLTGAVQTYVTALKNAGVGVRYVTQPPANGLAWNPILSVTANGANQPTSFLTLTAPPVVPYTVGQILRFSGVNRDNLPGFPATCQVLSITAGPPYVIDIGYRLRNAASVFPPKMAVTPALYSLASLSGFMDFTRFSERKTGRPFGALRGAARTVTRRQ